MSQTAPISKHPQFAGKNFVNMDISELLTDDTTFKKCVIDGATLRNAKRKGLRFIECTFKKSDLSLAILDEATFTDCRFIDCVLTGTSVQKSVIKNCDFISPQVVGTRFDDAHIFNSTFTINPEDLGRTSMAQSHHLSFENAFIALSSINISHDARKLPIINLKKAAIAGCLLRNFTLTARAGLLQKTDFSALRFFDERLDDEERKKTLELGSWANRKDGPDYLKCATTHTLQTPDEQVCTVLSNMTLKDEHKSNDSNLVVCTGRMLTVNDGGRWVSGGANIFFPDEITVPAQKQTSQIIEGVNLPPQNEETEPHTMHSAVIPVKDPQAPRIIAKQDTDKDIPDLAFIPELLDREFANLEEKNLSAVLSIGTNLQRTFSDATRTITRRAIQTLGTQSQLQEIIERLNKALTDGSIEDLKKINHRLASMKSGNKKNGFLFRLKNKSATAADGADNEATQTSVIFEVVSNMLEELPDAAEKERSRNCSDLDHFVQAGKFLDVLETALQAYIDRFETEASKERNSPHLNKILQERANSIRKSAHIVSQFKVSVEMYTLSSIKADGCLQDLPGSLIPKVCHHLSLIVSLFQQAMTIKISQSAGAIENAGIEQYTRLLNTNGKEPILAQIAQAYETATSNFRQTILEPTNELLDAKKLALEAMQNVIAPNTTTTGIKPAPF